MSDSVKAGDVVQVKDAKSLDEWANAIALSDCDGPPWLLLAMSTSAPNGLHHPAGRWRRHPAFERLERLETAIRTMLDIPELCAGHPGVMGALRDIFADPPAETPKDRTLQEQIDRLGRVYKTQYQRATNHQIQLDQLADKLGHLAAQVDRLMAERRTA